MPRKTHEVITTNRGNTIELHYCYPEKNDPQMVEAICRNLIYIGLFDGVDMVALWNEFNPDDPIVPESTNGN